MTVTGNGEIALGGVVSGSGSIAVSGSSNCIIGLDGANSYTGGTFLNSGEVQVTSDSGLGAAGVPLAFNGGNLFVNAGGASTTTINRGMTLGTGGGQITAALVQYGTLALPSAIQGPGALTISGYGSDTYVSLTGPNTYSGGTAVNDVTLLGTTSTLQGNISLTNVYAGLEFQQGFNGTYSGAITGVGGVEVSATGVVTFTGSNTYAGGTEVYQGILEVSGSSLPASGGLMFGGAGAGGGVIQFIGPASYTGGATWSGSGGFSARNGKLTVNLGGSGATFNIPANHVLVFGSPTANAETEFQNPIFLGSSPSLPVPTIQVNAGAGGDYALLSGQISGGNALIKTGNGTLELTAANTFSGGLTISGGEVWAATAASLPGFSTSGQVSVAAGAMLAVQSGAGTNRLDERGDRQPAKQCHLGQQHFGPRHRYEQRQFHVWRRHCPGPVADQAGRHHPDLDRREHVFRPDDDQRRHTTDR